MVVGVLSGGRVMQWNMWWVGCLGLLTAACGGEPEGIESNEGGDEALGQVSQAVNQTAFDTQVAATISRRNGSPWEYWVFACDANFKMRRRVSDDNGTWLSHWIGVAGGYDCATPPSVGKFAGTGPKEALGAYWRDLSNHLIEAWYKPDGTSMVTDLSDYLEIGPIAGTPVVADAINQTGATERISVAVRTAGLNQLHTLDFYWGEWHTAPILMSNGAIATAIGNTMPVLQRTTERGSFIAAQTSATTHTIFSRKYWSQSYKEYAKITNSPPGLVTFLAMDSANAPADCSTKWGCATYRGPLGLILVASLQTGGDITNNFVAVPEPLFGGTRLGGSLWSTVGANLDSAYARTSEGKLGRIIDETWDFHVYPWQEPPPGVPPDGVNITSAVTVGTRMNVFYAVGSSYRLHDIGGANTPWTTDTGLNVLPP
jgi:hypothetical protein